MGFHLTQRLVGSLKPQKKSNYIRYDDEVKGFGIRVTAHGAKSFVLNYYAAGRERRCTIGSWPEWSADAARDEALALRKDIRGGKDPLREKEIVRGEPTVEELAEEYIERHAIPYKKPSSVKQDRRMLMTRVLPALGHLRVSAVIKRDCELLHNSLKSTPYEANRVKSLVSKMFSCAVEWNLRPDNPCRKIPRFHEEKHEGWLTEQQLQRFDLALNEYPVQGAADALRLLMLTGAREGEVLNPTWPQFDLQRGIWTKPSHATKEKKDEHPPLSDAALLILRRMKKQKGEQKVAYLFPGHDGEKARTTLRNAWRIVCRDAGLATEYRVQGKRRMLKRWKPTVRINDLRHSYASYLVSRGASLYVVGKLLGHTQPSTTQRYAHIANSALRSVTNSFSEVLQARLEPPKTA
jgi:integrase